MKAVGTTKHGIPYDWRKPTRDRLRRRLWNPSDPRTITPQVWGVGWSVNLAHVPRRLLALLAGALVAGVSLTLFDSTPLKILAAALVATVVVGVAVDLARTPRRRSR